MHFLIHSLKSLIRLLRRKVWHFLDFIFPKPKQITTKLPSVLPTETFNFVSIGKIHSVFKDKFGTPRQGSLVPHSRGCLVLDRNAIDVKWSLTSLEAFSHVWLIFVFHTNTNVQGKPTPRSKIKPPQGGGAKVGVYASRSPHRVNPIGLTLAKIEKVDENEGVVYLSGLDLCDQTPILDIKPYCEHVDWPGLNVAITASWVTNPKFNRCDVSFSEEAEQSLIDFVDKQGVCEWYRPGESSLAKQALIEIISLDPRDLNRGRGEFAGENESGNSNSHKKNRIRTAALVRPVYLRFDVLDVIFTPNDSNRSFQVQQIKLYSDFEKKKHE